MPHVLKKLLILSVFFAGFSFSCTTENPSFYIHKENDFIIQAGLNTIETHFFVINNISNTFEQELLQLGINKEQIKSIHAGKGLFTPIYEEFDFDVIREVSIWLVSIDDPLLRKEIYYRDQVPFNQKNELLLLSGLADLNDFLNSQENYNLEIQLKFRNFVPTNLETRFTYSFAIFTN